MTVKIKAINIHAFRGILDLDVELKGRNLLIRGENGTGKSSLVESFEFFFTGKITHLEGTQGLSLKRYGPHVKFKSRDVKIDVTFNPGNIALTKTFASSPSPPEQLNEFFQITQKGTFILRRSQILEFIMSKPAERFRSIGSIIGIGTLDETELEMKRVRDELKSEIDFQKKRIGELRRNLSSLMKKDAAKVEDIVPSLNEICKENNLPLVKSFEDLEAHAEKMLKRAKKSEKTDESGVLNKILEATQTELISNEICDDFTDINNTVRELLDEDLRRTRSVVDLLESGRRVIEDEERNTCPLCKQRIERERVLIEIDTRLKTLRGLSQKESKVRTISKVLLKQLDELIRELERVLSYLDSFSELAKEKTQAANKIAFLKEFKSHIMSLETLENEIPLPEFIQHQAKINKLWRDIQEKCRQLLDDI